MNRELWDDSDFTKFGDGPIVMHEIGPRGLTRAVTKTGPLYCGNRLYSYIISDNTSTLKYGWYASSQITTRGILYK